MLNWETLTGEQRRLLQWMQKQIGRVIVEKHWRLILAQAKELREKKDPQRKNWELNFLPTIKPTYKTTGPKH
jgi:hypothetical protein